jgi:hypothetical protein
MRLKKKGALIILTFISVLLIILPLTFCSCSKSFPYQGSINGNWSGQLTILGRNIPLGGTISLTVDTKGVGSGTLTSTSGGANPATMNALVDSDGNLTGTVSFTLNGTTFTSDWHGKMIASGSSLSIQGTWTSQHGSGTFTGTGTKSK